MARGTVTDGICAYTSVSCNIFTQCDSDLSCRPDYICVNNTRCGEQSVCIPIALIKQELCPSNMGRLRMYEVNENTHKCNSSSETQSFTALWSFDYNTDDTFNNLNGVAVGRPAYGRGILGRGASIRLDSSSRQFVSIVSDLLRLKQTSFTIEMWIYLTKLGSGEIGLFCSCPAATQDSCLHFVIRGQRLYCGFYANDVAGRTVVKANAWNHVAFVYNTATFIQELWFNGQRDASRFPATPLQGDSRVAVIGSCIWPASPHHSTIFSGFDGFIDEVKFEPRAKSALEILTSFTVAQQQLKKANTLH